MRWNARTQRVFSGVALSGLLLAIAAAVVSVIGGLGSRMNWWHFGMGFTLLRWGVYIGIAAAVVSLPGLFAGVKGGGRPVLLRAVLSVAISLPVIILPLTWLNTASSVPPIHDITTDFENPPQFEEVVNLRAKASNGLDYGGEPIAAQQREAYPYIQPLQINASPEAAFNTALQTVRELGWDVVAHNSQRGRIEAVDTTFWFGFKDDVVIRITALDGGSRVDIRSVSRVGRSDVGANAKRIHTFIRTFRKKSG
jgi:uncharacterized protein (DUF1499 family)